MHLRHKTDSPRTGVALAAGGNMYFSPACRNTSLATKHRSALMLPLQERLTVHESANTVNLIVRCFNFKACKAPDLCLPKWSSQLAECCGVHGILVLWLSAMAGSAGCWLPPHTEMHSAAARSLPHKCWPGKLGARRWETAVVETQRASSSSSGDIGVGSTTKGARAAQTSRPSLQQSRGEK